MMVSDFNSGRAGGRPKALVFIDYDMLIRHFIQSGAFEEMSRRYDITWVFHSDATSEKQGIYTDVDQLDLPRVQRAEVPRKRMGRWDMLYCPTVLNNQRGTSNFESRLELMYVTRDPKWTRRYKLLSSPYIFPFYRWLFQRAMGVYKPLRDLIAREKPNIVIHPSILQGYFINELCPICRELKIPFLCLMNSWDNPSQKAAATGRPDKLAVWGPQSRRHAIEYMKMPPEDVHVFGAAQFQLYRDPVRESDAELRETFGAPQGVPIILYGGTSKGVMEAPHLELLDRAIEEGRIPKCHILYRPHPWRGPLMEGERDFYSYAFRHVTMDPFMADFYRGATMGGDVGFSMASYDVTRKVMKLVSAVTSALSTILLEAIMHQKPVQILLEGQTGSKLSEGLLKLGPNLTHFADLQGPGVLYCSDREQIAPGCARLLELTTDEPTLRALKALGEEFVDMSGPRYGERLASLADEMIGGASASVAQTLDASTPAQAELAAVESR